MNRPTTSTEIETVILKVSTKVQEQTASKWILSNIYRKVNTYPFETLSKKKKTVEEETLPASFYEASITLILKPNKDNKKKEKKITGQYRRT